MPSTRSSSGLSALPKETATVARAKRKAAAAESPTKSPSPKKVRVAAEEPQTIPDNSASLVPNGTDTVPAAPAILSFDFAEAKKYLIGVDARFEDIFEKLTCKPFEELDQVHPFRALATSILGQQISWLAARSINHKFIRIYDESIPESHAEYAAIKSATSFFPSPQQVSVTDIPTLRSAGLSERKAQYILDLAKRFSDGRLSTEKLLKASDEQLNELLIQIYGVGQWTVDMFSIFSMRRPNILPVADLGVQRGVLRWFLSLHEPTFTIGISPEKLPATTEVEDTKTPHEANARSVSKSTGKKRGKGKAPLLEEEDALPIFEEVDNGQPSTLVYAPENNTNAKDISSVPPAPPIERLTSHAESADNIDKDDAKMSVDAETTIEIAAMPLPFTPTTKKSLTSIKKLGGKKPPSLPKGLTLNILKSRLDPKKKVKGAMLTPKEMEELTECWKPYRSLAVYYMWAIADGN